MKACATSRVASWLRYLWALPNTLLGLMAVLVGSRVRVVEGVVEMHGPVLRWVLRKMPIQGGAAALTLGHVVWGCDQACLDKTRRHERVHVRQYERWGPLFLPVYVGVAAWLWLRGKDAYRWHPFEREAYGEA